MNKRVHSCVDCSVAVVNGPMMVGCRGVIVPLFRVNASGSLPINFYDRRCQFYSASLSIDAVIVESPTARKLSGLSAMYNRCGRPARV